LGYVIIPEWHYEDLVSENQIKSDRIQQLESDVKDKANRLAEIKSNSDRQKAIIQQLQELTDKLDLNNRFLNERLEEINAQNAQLNANLLEAQRELDAIKEAYTKTLAANAELDLKLGDAIASISKSEQQYNELTVQISLERTANKIAIENHRRDVLITLDNLEISQKAS
jgi:chromosome segregation ATPase